MIHQLLHLTRPLFVLDCETTGVDPQKDRIVELGFQQWGPDGLVKEWRSLVHPVIPIPASATKVHGITDTRLTLCNQCGLISGEHSPIDLAHPFKPVPTFKHLAANLAKGFTDCDFAGKNVRFDLRILAAEMARAGQEWSYAGARIVDIDRLEQLAVPRDLGSLHEKYVGMKHDGAHGALSDVRASAMVIAKQLETFPNLPRDLDKLHALQFPGMIDLGGRFRFINGVACVAFGKWNGKPMRLVDVKYWDWLLSSDFSHEVKTIAVRAKIGQYPENK
jgi:DNA polymerase-3 subunit epsilon